MGLCLCPSTWESPGQHQGTWEGLSQAILSFWGPHSEL